MVKSPVKFNFKTITINSEVEGVAAVDYKRPSCEINLPQLEVADVLSIIEAGGKSLELLLAEVNAVIYDRTRELMANAIDDNPNIQFNDAWLATHEADLEWATIANIEPAKKGGSAGIAKETWAAFEIDYCDVMQQLHPERAIERTKLAARFLKSKFSSIKSDKAGITRLQGFLGEWFSYTAKAEDFAEVYAAINTRATELLAMNFSAADAIE